MNIVYDVVLNFFNMEEGFYECYEWNKTDSLIYIEKIPIVKIPSKQLENILGTTIRISKDMLNRIYNKTFSSTGIIPYCMLITDMSRVIALYFNEEGILMMQSSLLLDEEEAIMDESRDFNEEEISYDILTKKDSLSFVTRKEKKIQKFLLREINNLYNHQLFDEIHYLYLEICSDFRTKEEEYFYLMEKVQDYFYLVGEPLYEILQYKKEP